MIRFENIRISVYRNVRDRVGMETNLAAFLHSERHRETIARLRSIEDKTERNALKKSLPLATISGIFRPSRKAENLVKHSGLICIDIDRDDNLQLGDLSTIRMVLEQRPEVAYAAQSVSGRGLFAIIPLAYPERHLEQFLALQQDYARLGIHLDIACKDVCRLRCVSWDDHPYFNPSAEIYEGLYEERPQIAAPQPTVSYTSTTDRDIAKVERCVALIRETSIDITDDYNEWFSIACSLSALGENGRYFFHEVSRVSSKYRASEADKKFSEALRTRGSKSCTLATFFFICRSYGITYKR